METIEAGNGAYPINQRSVNMTTIKVATVRTKVSANAEKAIVSVVKKSTDAEKAKISAVDVLVAEGYKSTDFVSPKSKTGGSTATEELFDDINRVIVLGFEKRVQKLLAYTTAEAKALPELEKKDRRYWFQQIGSKRNDFKTALEKREAATLTGRPTGNQPTKLEMLKRALEDALKRTTALDPEKDSIPDAVDLVELSANIKKSLAMLKQ
jgi:hypothetical protein